MNAATDEAVSLLVEKMKTAIAGPDGLVEAHTAVLACHKLAMLFLVEIANLKGPAGVIHAARGARAAASGFTGLADDLIRGDVPLDNW